MYCLSMWRAMVIFSKRIALIACFKQSCNWLLILGVLFTSPAAPIWYRQGATPTPLSWHKPEARHRISSYQGAGVFQDLRSPKARDPSQQVQGELHLVVLRVWCRSLDQGTGAGFNSRCEYEASTLAQSIQIKIMIAGSLA